MPKVEDDETRSMSNSVEGSADNTFSAINNATYMTSSMFDRKYDPKLMPIDRDRMVLASEGGATGKNKFNRHNYKLARA